MSLWTRFYLSQSLHFFVNFIGVFVAIILASQFPTIVQKNGFIGDNVPNEKSQLLKHDKETTVKYCEKTHGLLN